MNKNKWYNEFVVKSKKTAITAIIYRFKECNREKFVYQFFLKVVLMLNVFMFIFTLFSKNKLKHFQGHISFFKCLK